MDKQWTCKCGRVNDGDICKDCGNDRPQASGVQIERARQVIGNEMKKFIGSPFPLVISVLLFVAALAMVLVSAALLVYALAEPDFATKWEQCPIPVLRVIASSVTGFSETWGIISIFLLFIGGAVFMTLSGIYLMLAFLAAKKQQADYRPLYTLQKILNIFRTYVVVALGVFAFAVIINTAGNFQFYMDAELAKATGVSNFFDNLDPMLGSFLRALYCYIPMLIVLVSYAAAIIFAWLVFKVAIGFTDRLLYRVEDPTCLRSDCKFPMITSFVCGGLLSATALALVLVYSWILSATSGSVEMTPVIMTPLLIIAIPTAVLAAIMFVMAFTAQNYEKLQQRIVPAIKEVNNGEY